MLHQPTGPPHSPGDELPKTVPTSAAEPPEAAPKTGFCVSLRALLRPEKSGFLTELLALLFAALMVGLDQWTKVLIHANFQLYESRPVIPGILNFRYIPNEGAAFGILENQRWVFMSVTTVVIIAALVLLILRKIRSNWIIWSLALVIAGGIGNMIDRVARSYVVDFLDLQFVKFYVFNVADCCVVVGALMMMAYFLLDTVREHKAAQISERSPEDEQRDENHADV